MPGKPHLIDSVEEIEDCGRGHACSFCAGEQSCRLDKANHDRVHLERRLQGIDRILLVLANKGGVGKSTVAANLATALAALGLRVGLADADIHGPNAPRLFGLQDESVVVSDNGIAAPVYPVEGTGSLKIGSIAFFLERADVPVVWRDAYKHEYIHHMLGSFDWGSLDFLVLDMPPGTGNELMTLSSAIEGKKSGALLVSSADAIVLQDTMKAARFCLDSELRLLGLVENHAGVLCPHCGGEFQLFPRAAEIDHFDQLGIQTLARLPFTPEIGNCAASGIPVATVDSSPLSAVFLQLAQTCLAGVSEDPSQDS
jgi:Mrp family chromosome partitioning ATPase